MSQPLPPGAFAKALQEKRRAQRKRRILLWSISGGIVVLLAAAVIVAFFSPLLSARKVEASGTSLLTPEQVSEAAAVQLGVPLLRQDLAGIDERVRALEPVRDVRVSLGLPDAVRIEVSERALVYQRALGGEIEWIDADGVVFHRSEDPTDGVIQVDTSTDDPRLLADIATVVTHIPEDLRPDVTGVSASAVDRITLKLTDRRTVVWGSAEESELKGQVLDALVQVDARTYDVSAPRHPTTK